jgi:hypothetical protein
VCSSTTAEELQKGESDAIERLCNKAEDGNDEAADGSSDMGDQKQLSFPYCTSCRVPSHSFHLCNPE